MLKWVRTEAGARSFPVPIQPSPSGHPIPAKVSIKRVRKMMNKKEDVNTLLDEISKGDEKAKKELFALLYRDLHAIAHRAMRKENLEITLQTTALLHETFMSLLKTSKTSFKNQGHFYSVAARAMRFILVDEARKRSSLKRGGDMSALPLDSVGTTDGEISITPRSIKHLEILDAALEKLSRQYPRKCTIVEMRFFAGLTIDKTAEVLGISPATVKREWEFTREWLREELRPIQPEEDGPDKNH